MTSLFDGMAGVLGQVFGAPVNIERPGQALVTVQGIFREIPVEQETADGRTFVTVSPTLRLGRDTGDLLVKGDIVRPSTQAGRSFIVLQSFPGASPAADAFVTYVLEEVRP